MRWRTALWAGLFWALDVNAAAINRIGKEDTFLLLFLLLGAYFYERAKVQARLHGDTEGAQRWYARSGGAFGLMLASTGGNDRSLFELAAGIEGAIGV